MSTTQLITMGFGSRFQSDIIRGEILMIFIFSNVKRRKLKRVD
jgi:hypothetical protein